MSDSPAQYIDGPQHICLSTANIRICPAAEAVYLSRGGWNAAGAHPAANRAVYVQIIIEEQVIVTQMATINGATVNGAHSLGIYDENYNQLVVSANTTQTGTSTIQVVDIADTTLPPGVYFLAISSNSATATYNRAQTNGNLTRSAGVGNMDTAYPLPSTITVPTTAGSSYIPLLVAFANGTIF